ncbi:hypothetical protein BJY01DRAFT_132104 [Aspergillus pseudoustus]|uniref:Uncharacterized protein n=1 Tax=Aspergillus pseudoustus TaxID=1810923 RepID=A0ABR4IKP4_9EURO
MPPSVSKTGRALIHGEVSGKLLYTIYDLNFWTDVVHSSGQIVAPRHPLRGQYIKDCILAVPSSLGSYGVSLAVIELLVSGCAPCAIILCHGSEAIASGAIIADKGFAIPMPVLELRREDFDSLQQLKYARIVSDVVEAGVEPIPPSQGNRNPMPRDDRLPTSEDAVLVNNHVAWKAVEILSSFARAQGVPTLRPTRKVHLDGCISTNLAVATYIKGFTWRGGSFHATTTISKPSIYSQRWTELGADATSAEVPNASANVCTDLGATIIKPEEVEGELPGMGPLVSLGERHWRLFLNSMRRGEWPIYPDLIDFCVAAAGHEPSAAIRTPEGREPTMLVSVLAESAGFEDTFFLLVGRAVGRVTHGCIPLVEMMEKPYSESDVLSFATGFITHSSAPIFHIKGVTPEADGFSGTGLKQVQVDRDDLYTAKSGLTTATDNTVSFVLLGNPNLSLTEFDKLNALCAGHSKLDRVEVIITTESHVYDQASEKKYLGNLHAFGALVRVDDYFFDLLDPPDVNHLGNVITNSTRYAHYPAHKVRRGVHFGNLRGCIYAAIKGVIDPLEP